MKLSLKACLVASVAERADVSVDHVINITNAVEELLRATPIFFFLLENAMGGAHALLNDEEITWMRSRE